MKDNFPIPCPQEAANTSLDGDLTLLESFRRNRVAQVLTTLELPALPLEADVALYSQIQDAVETAYLMGFTDSRLTLGEL